MFQHINSLLKNELPILLQLRTRFIMPCFASFGRIQTKISQRLHHELQPLCTLPYIDYSYSAIEGYGLRSKGVEDILLSLQMIASNSKLLHVCVTCRVRCNVLTPHRIVVGCD